MLDDKPQVDRTLNEAKHWLLKITEALKKKFVTEEVEFNQPGNEYEIEAAWTQIQDGIATLQDYVDRM